MSTTQVTQAMIPYIPNEAQKNAWVSLATKKNELSADLTKRELALQQLLIGVKDEDIAVKLQEYRKLHTDLIETRKGFTSIITDKLITPMMEWEKRSDPKTNATYLASQTRELEHRKKNAADATLQQNIATEKGQFKAHFQNEYMRISQDYRNALAGIIQRTYHDCLVAKTPPDAIDSALAIARLAMADEKHGQPAKFSRVHLTPEAASALYKELRTPDYSAILAETLPDLDAKFEMYAHDLANAEEAARASQTEFEATVVSSAKELVQEQAANVLMASAESFIMSDVKGVVSKKMIVIEDNSEGWIVKIMSAFLANFQVAFAKTKNKKYSALTVAQMAAALDAAGVKVQGVEYTTVEK